MGDVQGRGGLPYPVGMVMRPVDVALEAVRFLSITRGADDPTTSPTEKEIAEAEKLLGHPLPPSYLLFLAEAGLLMPVGWDLYWIGGPELTRRNIVVANQVERDHDTCPLPSYLIAFFDDDTGDQYCFDTRPRAEDLPDDTDPEANPLEYPVVLWDREKDRGTQLEEGLFVTGDDFLDWVKRYISDHF